MLYLDNVILKKSDSIPGFTYELQSTPNFNNFWRVIYCSCLLSLIDIRRRVRELSCSLTEQQLKVSTLAIAPLIHESDS